MDFEVRNRHIITDERIERKLSDEIERLENVEKSRNKKIANNQLAINKLLKIIYNLSEQTVCRDGSGEYRESFPLDEAGGGHPGRYALDILSCIFSFDHAIAMDLKIRENGLDIKELIQDFVFCDENKVIYNEWLERIKEHKEI